MPPQEQQEVFFLLWVLCRTTISSSTEAIFLIKPDRGPPTLVKVKLFPAMLSGKHFLFQQTSNDGRNSRFAGAQIEAQILLLLNRHAITTDKLLSLPHRPDLERIHVFSISGRFWKAQKTVLCKTPSDNQWQLGPYQPLCSKKSSPLWLTYCFFGSLLD